MKRKVQKPIKYIGFKSEWQPEKDAISFSQNFL
jgi:hypothetical protein